MKNGLINSQPFIELATFNIGDACCGIDILEVQEINKLIQITPVPLAPVYVKGIINLRGRIITVIDVGKRLGLANRSETGRRRNIIVRFEDEFIGLLVDSIGDVIQTERKNIEMPPANVAGVLGRYFEGIHKTEKQLVAILNLAAVLG